jgi:putative CocE/NonD family hydrolase
MMRMLSARGLPAATCRVAVERRIKVPAADGISLLTDHYVPLTDGPCPALLVRSPFGRGFPWDYVYGAQFAAHGFHVLVQSCRGTGGSGGTFEPWRKERADGRAAVAWLRQQDWFSGTLGAIGTSYLGYTAWALAAGAPPELRAVVADGSVDPYAFFYPGGAFALEGALVGATGYLFSEGGIASLTRAMLRLRRRRRNVVRSLPLIDAYPPALGGRADLFEQWLRNSAADGPYWSALDIGAETVTAGIPASLVTGWYDAQLDQTLQRYRRLREQGSDARLIIGPWNHTSIFDKGWPTVFPRALDELRTRLSAEPGRPDGPPVRVHVGGSGQWRDLPGWPPEVQARTWYLDADRTLRDQPPARAGTSSLRYDPADPTPSVGGPVMSGRSGSVDNRALEARPDVLTFTSAPLAHAMEILGPVSAQLRIHARNPHYDVFARLCDVDPRGRSLNICDGLTRHQPVDSPADETTVTVPMSSTAYHFSAGHRIRLQISGGAHPRYARNNGTADPQATATRLVPAETYILHTTEAPCALSLPVADGHASPTQRQQTSSGH